MVTIWQDVRYALRTLRRSPGFAAVAVLTLALGIGPNTAIFSLAYATLLNPLGYLHRSDTNRLVWFWETQPTLPTAPFSAPDFLDYQAQNHSFEQMAGARQMSFTLKTDGPPERLRGAVVSANFFSLLGAKPLRGRTFLPDDGKDGAARVAVLTYGFWQQHFAGDPSVVGRALTLNNEPATVVGILPADFRFYGAIDVWENPTHVVPEVFPSFSIDPRTARGMHYLPVIGLLKPGVTLARAQADIDGIVRRLQQQYRSNAGHGVHLISLAERAAGPSRTPMLVLSAVVGMVLLIACANVANLLLARATSRMKEIAIRASLGAGRARVMRQLLTESMLLALAGGALGILLAAWGVRLLVAALPEQIASLYDFRINGTVQLFTLGIAIATGLIFGLVPAMQVSSPNLNEVLKEGGRGASAGLRRSALRNLLVVSEFALSLILLVGAGLLVRSFTGLLEVKPGFNPERLVTMNISFFGSRMSTPEQYAQFMSQLLPRLQSLPGVESAAISNDLPAQGQDTNGTPTIEGQPPVAPGDEVLVGEHAITPGYFAAMGIALLRGREFTAQDVESSAPVVIINQKMAEHFWPGEDPLGKRFRLFGGQKGAAREIVGVAANVKQNGLDSGDTLDAYGPYAQNPWQYATIAVRAGGGVQQTVSAIRSEVQALDPDLPVYEAHTMDELMAESLVQQRLTLWLVGFFAALALVLASVGIYGVMSYVVTQRVHEIGIRMALGAQPGDILGLVIRQGMTLAICGLALGLAGAFGLTRFLRSLLFSVQPYDPLTFTVVSVLLAGVAILATVRPALRAMRVDPLVALRYE